MRARIVSVAENRGDAVNVDRCEAVEWLTGIVLVSISGTARSVERTNFTSRRFGFSAVSVDAKRGSGAVDGISLRFESFSDNVVTRAGARDVNLSLAFDGNLQNTNFSQIDRF